MISKRTRKLIIIFVILSCFYYRRSRRKLEFRYIAPYEYSKIIKNVKEIKHNNIKLTEANISKGSEQDNNKISSLTNGIFWSSYAESFVPKGLTFNESLHLIQKLRSLRVKSISRANQRVCGSGQNGKVILVDETKLCARNEKNKLSVYEALAFYLSRLLRMDNIPEVILTTANISSHRWNQSNIGELGWKDNQTVALIKWLDKASFETFMPTLIANSYKSGNPVTSNVLTQYTDLLKNTPHAIAGIIQWGTIIIFDNLIGHYDRLILYQSIRPRGKSRRSIEKGLYNSVQSFNGKIWLIDNESSFFYHSKHQDPIYKYTQLLKFNDRMLKTMCVFQSTLISELQTLSRRTSAFHFLFDFACSFEPMLADIRKDSSFDLFAKIFNTRLGQILRWVEHCQTLHNVT